MGISVKLDRNKATSACEILHFMLNNPATERYKEIGGSISFSTSGDIGYNFPRSFSTSDEDTNALVRAKFACDQNMVVSALSDNKSSLFYTTPENFKIEREEIQRKADEARREAEAIRQREADEARREEEEIAARRARSWFHR